MASMLPAILAGSSSSVLNAVAPSLLMLLKNTPGQQYAAFQQHPRHRVSHLANNEGGHAASGSTGAFGPNKISDSPSLQQAKRPFIPRGTAASHLRSFAAQPALAEDNQMFCFQCEQTNENKGCTTIGVCGKTPVVAGLQDLLIYHLKGLGSWAHLANENGVKVPQHIQSFITGATFSTLTNVNFDEARFVHMLQQATDYSAELMQKLAAAGVTNHLVPSPSELGWTGSLPHPMQYTAATDSELLKEQAKEVGVAARRESLGETLAGLQEMLMYGLKGMAAYTHHAEALGATSDAAYSYINSALHFLAQPAAKEAGAVLEMCMALGQANLGVLKMLSDAHASTFGTPTPTQVSLDPVEGKCILITGHDMHDLHELLKQTEGKGIDIYTHGEMLPAHGYPGLKKYPHLKGHFGGAWYRQKIDFSSFPGPVVATTNCVLDPPKSYKNRLFTTNETGLAGVTHIGIDKDYSPAIKAALDSEGWTQDNLPDPAEVAEERGESGRLGTVTVGFGHEAVLGVAGAVVDAVKTGKLEHIFVIGGCDGSEPQRKYYDKLARLMPLNTMVLTLGCGKFRIFDQDFGALPGTQLPRLLDMGQCNDAYSALVVAMELAKVFNTDVNGLPLSLDISWFEQKAVAVLLTLLSLGVKNVRLGPRLPAFLTPEAVKQLVDAFNIKPADTENAAADLKLMMRNN